MENKVLPVSNYIQHIHLYICDGISLAALCVYKIKYF